MSSASLYPPAAPNPSFLYLERGKHLISFLIAIVILLPTIATADTIEVTVCAFDSEESSPLAGAEVEIQETGNPSSTGATAGSGCVTLQVEVSTISGIDDVPGFGPFLVQSAFPNPTSGFVSIPFSSDTSQRLEVGIFDILGREVAAQDFGPTGPGSYRLNINATALSRGIYFYRMAGGQGSMTGQFVKLGDGSNGRASIALETSSAGPGVAKTLASTLTVSVEQSGYAAIQQTVTVEDGETVNFFLDPEVLESSFEYAAAALQVSFQNTSAGADSYAWDFGDGASSTQENPVHTYASAGEYDVKLVAYREDAADSTTETITVSELSGPVTSDFTFSSTGLIANYTNQSTNADTYLWQFGDGSTSGQSDPTHVYATSGDYTVVLIASNRTHADTSSQVVTISGSLGEDAMIPMDRTDLFSPEDTYYGEAYGWPDDPSPVPSGSVIIGTGYSNASQHFNTFDAQYQSLMKPEFVNCGVGSNAIENWIGQNTELLFEGCIDEVEAAGYSASDVALSLNLIANQLTYPAFPNPGSGVDSLEVQVQRLGALLEQYFPNAIHMYTTGEPAWWVDPNATNKCPRICEPVRYETAFGVNRALSHMNPDKHIHGAYLWSGLETPNASGELWVIEDFLSPTPEGYANQHPSNEGRAKASRIYHAFLSEKYPTWYPQ